MHKLIAYTLFTLFFLISTQLVGLHAHDLEKEKNSQHECVVCFQNRIGHVDTQSLDATIIDFCGLSNEIKTSYHLYEVSHIEKSIILPFSNAPPLSLG